jgi:lipoprotein-anchoring transpeptidase ErfK/SrfK
MYRLKRTGIYFTVFLITFFGVYFSYSKYANIKQVEYKYNTVESKRELTSDLNSVNTISPTDSSTSEETTTESEVTAWVEPHEPVRAGTSNDKYEIKVVKSEQKTYIYKNDELFKEFVCSTGLESEGYITETGVYYINSYYGKSFYNQKYESGAKYWVGFIGSVYLFHSVPIDANGDIIEEEVEKLGTQASHGCVRLSEENAFWFYETIPEGTKVNIVE